MLDESEADPEGKGTACAQIAFSSAVLLNKIDLVDSAGLDVIEKRIKAINSTVRITRCQEGRVPVAELFDVGAFQRFLNKYLGEEEDAKDFLRVKGVLDIKGSDN